MDFKLIIPAILVVWNLITLAMMGADKSKAKKGKWRISEKTLFFCAFFSGGIGILCGMLIFRHKTKHWSFRILVPAAVLVNAAVWYLAAGLH